MKTVVPWIEQHLSTIRDAQSGAIAGVSAGGFGAGGAKRSWTFGFDRELRSLSIKDELWSQAPGIPVFGRHQLPAALEYAEPVG